VSDKVRFVLGDLREVDFSDATIVALSLVPKMMAALKPVLLANLRPGSRVVSQDFDFGADWKPSKVEHAFGGKIYLWITPEDGVIEPYPSGGTSSMIGFECNDLRDSGLTLVPSGTFTFAKFLEELRPANKEQQESISDSLDFSAILWNRSDLALVAATFEWRFEGGRRISALRQTLRFPEPLLPGAKRLLCDEEMFCASRVRDDIWVSARLRLESASFRVD